MCLNCKTGVENGSCMPHVVTMKNHFTIISFLFCLLWFSAASSDYGRTKWEVHSYSYLAQHFAQSNLLEKAILHAAILQLCKPLSEHLFLNIYIRAIFGGQVLNMHMEVIC